MRRLLLGGLVAVAIALTPALGGTFGCRDGQAWAQRCCRVCRVGKACGDSCIARWKTCHKGRGCACDASAALHPVVLALPRVRRIH